MWSLWTKIFSKPKGTKDENFFITLILCIDQYLWFGLDFNARTFQIIKTSDFVVFTHSQFLRILWWYINVDIQPVWVIIRDDTFMSNFDDKLKIFSLWSHTFWVHGYNFFPYFDSFVKLRFSITIDKCWYIWLL